MALGLGWHTPGPHWVCDVLWSQAVRPVSPTGSEYSTYRYRYRYSGMEPQNREADDVSIYDDIIGAA